MYKYNFGFLNTYNDTIIHLLQWQYWWWFWFTFLLCLYYILLIRFIYFRSLKFNPKIVTSYRSHGKWGDLIICFLPISWCLNILSNSTTLLKLVEWQSESNFFTLRVRGKQWYWIYKFDTTSLENLLSQKNLTKHFGTTQTFSHNNLQTFTNYTLFFDSHIKSKNLVLLNQKLNDLQLNQFLITKTRPVNAKNFIRLNQFISQPIDNGLVFDFNKLVNVNIPTITNIFVSQYFHKNTILKSDVSYNRYFRDIQTPKTQFDIFPINLVSQFYMDHTIFNTIYLNFKIKNFCLFPLLNFTITQNINFNSILKNIFFDFYKITFFENELSLDQISFFKQKKPFLLNFKTLENTHIPNYLEISRSYHFFNTWLNEILLCFFKYNFFLFNESNFKHIIFISGPLFDVNAIFCSNINFNFKKFVLVFNSNFNLDFKPNFFVKKIDVKIFYFENLLKFWIFHELLNESFCRKLPQVFNVSLIKKQMLSFNNLQPFSNFFNKVLLDNINLQHFCKLNFDSLIKLIKNLQNIESIKSSTLEQYEFLWKNIFFENLNNRSIISWNFNNKSNKYSLTPDFDLQTDILFTLLKQSSERLNFDRALTLIPNINIEKFFLILHYRLSFYKLNVTKQCNLTWKSTVNTIINMTNKTLWLLPDKTPSQTLCFSSFKNNINLTSFFLLEAKIAEIFIYPNIKDSNKLNFSLVWQIIINMTNKQSFIVSSPQYLIRPFCLLNVNLSDRVFQFNFQSFLFFHGWFNTIFTFNIMQNTNDWNLGFIMKTLNIQNLFPLFKFFSYKLVFNFLNFYKAIEVIDKFNTSKPSLFLQYNNLLKTFFVVPTNFIHPNNHLNLSLLHLPKNSLNKTFNCIIKPTLNFWNFDILFQIINNLNVFQPIEIPSSTFLLNNIKFSIHINQNFNYLDNIVVKICKTRFNKFWILTNCDGIQNFIKIYPLYLRTNVFSFLDFKTLELKTCTQIHLCKLWSTVQIAQMNYLKKGFIKFNINKMFLSIWYNLSLPIRIPNINFIDLQINKFSFLDYLIFNIFEKKNVFWIIRANNSFPLTKITIPSSNLINKKNFSFWRIINFSYKSIFQKQNFNSSYLVLKQKPVSDWSKLDTKTIFFEKVLFTSLYNETYLITSSNRIQYHNNMRLLKVNKILFVPSNLQITTITNSFDVIHSWFIPALGLKMDCVPGRSTHHSLYIDIPGMYYGQCAEICGRFHHHMPIRLCALSQQHFFIWINHNFLISLQEYNLEHNSKTKYTSKL